MIARTLIITLLLFLGYNFYLMFGHPNTGTGQHQWQKNVIEAQEYIYEHQGTENVLVGSSLTFRITNDMLPDNYYNLSLGGGSIFTGLEIIKRCERKPKVVFIETNIMIRPADEGLLMNLFRPVVKDMRHELPAFKEKNQPVNLLLPVFNKYSAKAVGVKPFDASAASIGLRMHLKNNSIVREGYKDSLERGIGQLKSAIAELNKQGIKVVLFEMPVHCRLKSSPLVTYADIRIKESFPEREYNWLPEPDCTAYQYSDGEHLEYNSAKKFAGWFGMNSK
jgi:hypothetical protein